MGIKSKKKKRQSKDDRISISLVISIISLLVAGYAGYEAREANKISKQQLEMEFAKSEPNFEIKRYYQRDSATHNDETMHFVLSKKEGIAKNLSVQTKEVVTIYVQQIIENGLNPNEEGYRKTVYVLDSIKSYKPSSVFVSNSRREMVEDKIKIGQYGTFPSKEMENSFDNSWKMVHTETRIREILNYVNEKLKENQIQIYMHYDVFFKLNYIDFRGNYSSQYFESNFSPSDPYYMRSSYETHANFLNPNEETEGLFNENDQSTNDELNEWEFPPAKFSFPLEDSYQEIVSLFTKDVKLLDLDYEEAINRRFVQKQE